MRARLTICVALPIICSCSPFPTTPDPKDRSRNDFAGSAAYSEQVSTPSQFGETPHPEYPNADQISSGEEDDPPDGTEGTGPKFAGGNDEGR